MTVAAPSPVERWPEPFDLVISCERPCEDIPPDVDLGKRGGRSGAGRWRWWVAHDPACQVRQGGPPVRGLFGAYLPLPAPELRRGDQPCTFVVRVMSGGRYVLGVGTARYDLEIPDTARDGWRVHVHPLDLGTAHVVWSDPDTEETPF